MMSFLQIFQHLLPNARAWRITVGKRLRQFFEGLADGLATPIKTFLDNVYLDQFPQTTRDLATWEGQFSLINSSGLTEQERRDRLEAAWQALGGQDPTYIQNTLQGLGFPVYVHEWWEPRFETVVTNAFDLDTARGGKYLDVSLEMTDPQGVSFSPDGLRLFMVGIIADAVFQYSLTTAYDLSTATYTGNSFSVATEVTDPLELVISSDGSILFVIGRTSSTIYQYALSTAWEILTASYTGNSFSVAAEVTNSTGLASSGDGRTLFVSGFLGTSVFQYNLTTAWDLTTASYSGKSFSVAAEVTDPKGLAVRLDGTAVYVVDTVLDAIFQYTLTTPWDASTASYSGKSISIAEKHTAPTGLEVSPDGRSLFLVGTGPDIVYQYRIVAAWDISTATYSGPSFSVAAEDTAPTGVSFREDGLAMFVVGVATDTVYQYTLSTAWDVSTASYSGKSFSVAAEDGNLRGVFFRGNGSTLYLSGTNTDTVYQYTLSTAWDVSTASYSGKSFSVAAEDTAPTGVSFREDGLAMFVVGLDTDTVYQYTLSTAWDVSTASYSGKSFSVAAEDTAPTEVAFRGNGSTLYISGTDTDTVYQYTLSTAWDVSTASYSGKSFSVAAEDTTPTGVSFREDGLAMFVVGVATDTVYQYTLSTAWDVSTASYSGKSFSVAAEDTTPTGVFFRGNGSAMFVCGNATDTVYRYDIGTVTETPIPPVTPGVKECVEPRNPFVILRDGTGEEVTYFAECGEPLAECGELLAECGERVNQPGYVLVNRISVSARAFTALCGDIGVECGEALAACGEYSGFIEEQIPYYIPFDEDKWSYFLYIGGETFGQTAKVPQIRRDEFEAACLKICPAQQWLGLLVDYT